MQRAGALTLQSFGARPPLGAPVARLLIEEDHHLDGAFWDARIEPRRSRLLEEYRAGWNLQYEAVARRRCLAEVLQQAYEALDPRIPVTRCCHSCPWCREQGDAKPPGRLLPRHSPDSPFSPVEALVSEQLTAFLGDCGHAWIAIPTEASRDLSRLSAVVHWFVERGLRDIVLPSADHDSWLQELQQADLPPIFFHEETPTGIRRGRPCVVLACAEGRTTSERVETLKAHFARGSVVLAPASLRQSDRADRELRDVVTDTRVMALDHWEEEYLA